MKIVFSNIKSYVKDYFFIKISDLHQISAQSVEPQQKTFAYDIIFFLHFFGTTDMNQLFERKLVCILGRISNPVASYILLN